jgi:hypothetical protein
LYGSTGDEITLLHYRATKPPLQHGDSTYQSERTQGVGRLGGRIGTVGSERILAVVHSPNGKRGVSTSSNSGQVLGTGAQKGERRVGVSWSG